MLPDTFTSIDQAVFVSYWVKLMVPSGNTSTVDHFRELKGARIGRNRRHRLIDIVMRTVVRLSAAAKPGKTSRTTRTSSSSDRSVLSCYRMGTR